LIDFADQNGAFARKIGGVWPSGCSTVSKPCEEKVLRNARSKTKILHIKKGNQKNRNTRTATTKPKTPKLNLKISDILKYMDTNILTYRTIIKKDGKYYHGFVPSLPGCHTQGTTIEETKKNLKEAIEGWIESRVAHKMPIPKEDGFGYIQTIDLNSLKIPLQSLRYT